MHEGYFYYLSDQYFIDFPDKFLMRNKEMIDGKPHNRPCFYAFKDSNTALYWMIPFSSQVDKFRDIYNKKVKKYQSSGEDGQYDVVNEYTDIVHPSNKETRQYIEDELFGLYDKENTENK